ALPGAQYSAETLSLFDSVQTIACSRPPPPMTRILTTSTPLRYRSVLVHNRQRRLAVALDRNRLHEQRDAIVPIEQVPIVARRLFRIVMQRYQLRLARERRKRIAVA